MLDSPSDDDVDDDEVEDAEEVDEEGEGGEPEEDREDDDDVEPVLDSDSGSAGSCGTSGGAAAGAPKTLSKKRKKRRNILKHPRPHKSDYQQGRLFIGFIFIHDRKTTTTREGQGRTKKTATPTSSTRPPGACLNSGTLVQLPGVAATLY